MSLLQPNGVDELLSDYFKSKLRQPWPPAPSMAANEPAGHRAAAQSNRSRYTLAASVAFLIGACWYFSNGSQPGERSATKPAPGGPGILNEGSAKMPKEFEKKKAPTVPMLD